MTRAQRPVIRVWSDLHLEFAAHAARVHPPSPSSGEVVILATVKRLGSCRKGKWCSPRVTPSLRCAESHPVPLTKESVRPPVAGGRIDLVSRFRNHVNDAPLS